MINLGASYSDLGRHSEALAMRESVLEFYRRVLPADHPFIGEGRVRGVLLRAFFWWLLRCAHALDFQARPWVIFVIHTATSEGTRKRLRCRRECWSSIGACCLRTILT